MVETMSKRLTYNTLPNNQLDDLICECGKLDVQVAESGLCNDCLKEKDIKEMY